MSPCAYPGLFFSSHALSEGTTTLCAVLVFSEIILKSQEGSQKCRKKIGRVLRCFHCSGKSINPSLQTVMKARLRVTSWESEDHRRQISESRTDPPLGCRNIRNYIMGVS